MSIPTRKQIAIVVVVAVLVVMPALAQTEQRYGAWTYDGEQNRASTSGDIVNLSVGCLSDGTPYLTIFLRIGTFDSGIVEFSFDDGTSYPFVFRLPGRRTVPPGIHTSLWADTTGNRNIASFVPTAVLDILRHVELQLQFNTSYSILPVSDRISLIGSTRAIEALPCP